MFFDVSDEFPHVAEIMQQKKVSDGMGGSSMQWTVIATVDCFVDTPRTDKVLQAHQMGIVLHRQMYYAYDDAFSVKNIRIKYEETLYEAAGDAEDQGGMREVLCLPLKRVT